MSEINPRAGILARTIAGFIKTYDPENDIVLEVERLPVKAALKTDPFTIFHTGHSHSSEVEAEGIELEIESTMRAYDYIITISVYKTDIPGPALYELSEKQPYDSDDTVLELKMSQEFPQVVADGLLGQSIGRVVQLPRFLHDLQTHIIVAAKTNTEGTTLTIQKD